MAKKKAPKQAPVESVAQLEGRLRVLRSILDLDPASQHAVNHARGVKRPDLIGRDRGINPAAWSQYCDEVRGKIPAAEEAVEAARAVHAEKLARVEASRRDLDVSLKVVTPDPDIHSIRHAARHVEVGALSPEQARALRSVQLGISGAHRQATAAEAMRYILDQLAGALAV